MNSNPKNPAGHKWAFRARFRAGAYGWKASKLAIQRIKEAVSEIKVVNRHDQLLAAEGAVLFIGKPGMFVKQVLRNHVSV